MPDIILLQDFEYGLALIMADFQSLPLGGIGQEIDPPRYLR